MDEQIQQQQQQQRQRQRQQQQQRQRQKHNLKIWKILSFQGLFCLKTILKVFYLETILLAPRKTVPFQLLCFQTWSDIQRVFCWAKSSKASPFPARKLEALPGCSCCSECRWRRPAARSRARTWSRRSRGADRRSSSRSRRGPFAPEKWLSKIKRLWPKYP